MRQRPPLPAELTSKGTPVRGFPCFVVVSSRLLLLQILSAGISPWVGDFSYADLNFFVGPGVSTPVIPFTAIGFDVLESSATRIAYVAADGISFKSSFYRQASLDFCSRRR